ncbi:MAG: flavin reductase family protein [Thalassobaculaceae bacterium]|nr:flavin reductase family protein [Thalassobaculaceae bacterium]
MRHALRRYITGVTVVTTLDETGALVGLTANSFTSVSLDPPLVLVCLGLKSRSYEHCVRQGRYTINILTDAQEDIAQQFAVRGGVRDDVCPWRLNDRGYPVLSAGLAHFGCRLVNTVGAGDHAILLGEVETISTQEDSKPLVFHDGALFGLHAGIPGA